MRRVALLLFSLGGPDCLDSVQPYLYNIFSDVFRRPNVAPVFTDSLAYVLATTRAPTTRGIFERLGGKSPLLDESQKQLDALLKRLNEGEDECQFTGAVGMTYWEPYATEAMETCLAGAPDDLILLPAYPHYSTTSTGAFLKQLTLAMPTRVHTIPSFHLLPEYVSAVAESILVGSGHRLSHTHVLFSAHGIPQSYVDDGDPYVTHVEQTIAAVVGSLGERGFAFSHSLAFQSRVGRAQWTAPYLADELARLRGHRVVVVPISFISDHSETLFELDIEYAELAATLDIKFLRAPVVGVDPVFIRGLARLVRESIGC